MLVKKLILVISVMIITFFIGFVLFALHIAAMKPPQNIENAESIVILTGGKYRIERGLELLARGTARKLLISGVHESATKTHVQEGMKANRELFKCCVDIGYQAKNTVGNAIETVAWLRKNKFKSAILVTNNYHMLRALIEINRIDSSFNIQTYPVVNTDLSNGKWLMNAEIRRVLALEYAKFLYAYVRSWVT